MSFEWEESDDKYTTYESTNEVLLSDIMYGFKCAECENTVHNSEFYGDADDPVWYYECHNCDLHYSVRPLKVTATVADADK
jgi:hypothetical protein